MSEWPMVGVAGARGVVGGTFLSILADAGLPADRLRAFGTERGEATYDDSRLPITILDPGKAADLEVLFLATDAAVSREIVAGPGRGVPLIVDNSSAFRLDPAVPLVVPEANAAVLDDYRGNLVANPNCTTAAAVVVLAPIRDAAGLASVDLASYQAVSGAGRGGLDAFEEERAAGGTERAEGSPFHGRIADSVVPQIDTLDEAGWSGEERKVSAELRKILGMPDLDVAATTVRVPVRTGHSVALHLRTERETTVESSRRRCATPRASNTAPLTEVNGTPCHSMPPDAIRCWSGGCAPSPGGSGASHSSSVRITFARGLP